MNRFAMFLAILVVMFCATSAIGQEFVRIEPGKYAELREKGVELFLKGDHNGALKKFLDIYDKQPMYCRNLFSLGQTYNELNEKREAYLFYVQARSAYGRLGAKCGYQFNEAELRRIDDMISSLAVSLTEAGYALGEERGHGDKCHVSADPEALDRKRSVPFPDQVSMPFVWWFKGTAEVRVECDGKDRTMVAGTAISGSPGSSAQDLVWYKKLTTWAWVSVGVGAGLAGVGGYILWDSNKREDAALADHKAGRIRTVDLLNEYLSDGHIIKDQNRGIALAWSGGTLLVVGGGLLLYDYFTSPRELKPKIVREGFYGLQPVVGGDTSLGLQWTMEF